MKKSENQEGIEETAEERKARLTADRVRRHRERTKEKNEFLLQVRVHRDDAQAVRDFAIALNEKRAK